MNKENLRKLNITSRYTWWFPFQERTHFNEIWKFLPNMEHVCTPYSIPEDFSFKKNNYE